MKEDYTYIGGILKERRRKDEAQPKEDWRKNERRLMKDSLLLSERGTPSNRLAEAEIRRYSRNNSSRC